MNIHYLDTSLMHEFLFNNTGFSIEASSLEMIYTSKITEIEIFRALIRLKNENEISESEFAESSLITVNFLNEINIIDINSEIVSIAKESIPMSLKTLDSIHVATAKYISKNNKSVLFHSLDKRQTNAAKFLGIQTTDTFV